jgi:hypothetical protein
VVQIENAHCLTNIVRSLCIFNLVLPHEKIISELQAQNPKLMKT